MNIQNVWFLDTETVPSEDITQLTSTPSEYSKRFATRVEGGEGSMMEHYLNHAALYAEHGKIICVVVAKLQGTKLYVKKIYGRHERDILETLKETFEFSKVPVTSICAHNGLEFDFPILFRRYVINNITPPKILNRLGKKPWDPGLEDTMQMWGGSQWKYMVSLDLLASVLGLPSPKKNMSGADVSRIYYGMFDNEINPGIEDELPFDKEERALKKIADYCAVDVITMVDVYARITGASSYTEISYQEVKDNSRDNG